MPSDRSSARAAWATWLAAAGGDPVTALVGKLAPYFGAFMLMMVVGAITIHGVYEVPFRGDAVLTGAAACLLVTAYLSVGALLQLLARNLAFGLSLTGIFCSPAFGFAGVGFPVLGMGEFARSWGSLLPLRWYIQILFDQAARGVPPADRSDRSSSSRHWPRHSSASRCSACDPSPESRRRSRRRR